MQTTLSVLALVGAAQAYDFPSVFGGFSRNDHTWCGPYGGEAGFMIENINECRQAANALNMEFHPAPVGQEWYAGCITQPHANHGAGHKAYFVPYDSDYATNNNHWRAPDRHRNGHGLMGGFVCKNLDWDAKGAFEMLDTCQLGAKIQSKQECANAARAFSFTSLGDAGTSDWEDGCIVNHGSAYWVPHTEGGDDTRHYQHNGGSICVMCTPGDKDTCGICFGDGSSCALPPPVPPPANPCDAAAYDLNTWNEADCERFYGVFGLDTNANKRKNFCAKNDSGSYRGIYGKRCGRKCCNVGYP